MFGVIIPGRPVRPLIRGMGREGYTLLD